MTYTASTSKVLGLRRSAARKARAALAATVVAVGLVLPSLAAGLVAPPAHASTTFLVTNTNDSGAGSLRQAILDANNTTGADAINFAVPQALRDPSTGVATVKPQSVLPTITEQVTINGYSQEGAHANTKAVGNDAALKIQLDGTNAGSSATGLVIHDASNSVIKGIVINRFSFSGISVSGAAVGNRIEGNFVGTDPTGTIDRGNGLAGVDFEPDTADSPSQNVVGGTTPAARNLISGNGNEGVFISGFRGGELADSNRIQGNYIGTDRSGTKDLGNDFGGIFLTDASGTIIGGTTAASRNVISGNGDEGVVLNFVSGTKVLGNRIGTTASGTGALGNDDDGVIIQSATSNNEIGDGTSAGSNTIAFNGKDGVQVVDSTSTGNKVSRNSIFSNVGLGIDLIGPGEGFTTNTPTPNDAGDVDSGPNGLQNRPSLGSAKTVSGTTTVKGTLSSAAGKTYKIKFYSNPSGEEGRKFVGSKSVTTGADGMVTFTFTPATKVSVGRTVTATATNATTGSSHDTSEFSTPRTVTSA